MDTGYAQEAPASQEEEELLSQLLKACCGSDASVDFSNLLGDVLALASAHAHCRESGLPETPQDIQLAVCNAVSGLKQQVHAAS